MKQILTFCVLVILGLLAVNFSELLVKIFPIVLSIVLVLSTGWVIYKLVVRTVHAAKDIYGD